jgi:hypothetical protein
VAALEAHNRTGLVGKEIYDFAFALITPLGAQDYYVFAHGVALLSIVIPAQAGIQLCLIAIPNLP